MKELDCEDVRIAAMAVADGEEALLPTDQIAEHMEDCAACRESSAEQLAAVIPAGVARRTHEIDLCSAIRDRTSSVGVKRPSLLRHFVFAGATAISLSMLLAGVTWWGREGVLSMTAQPKVEACVALEIYHIPWGPQQPITFEAHAQKYAVYFSPKFQAEQAAKLDPNLDVDKLRPILIVSRTGKENGTLFIDNTGTVVLAIQRPTVQAFHEGLAVVATRFERNLNLTDFGYIDRTGKLVIPGKFENAEPFSEGLAAVRANNKAGYIDRMGNFVIPPKYHIADAFHDGLARVQLDTKEHNDMQFINREGKELLTTNRWDVGPYSEGLMYANFPGQQGIDAGRTRGYVDRDFNFVFRLGEQSSGYWPGRCEPFQDGMAALEVGGSNQWGFINKQGKLTAPGPFFQVEPFSEGLAAVTTQHTNDPKWGFIDHDGNFVIREQFYRVGKFSEGLAPVLLPVEAADESSESDPPDPTLPRVKWGYIDPQGRTAIEPRFYHAFPFENGLALVKESPYHTGYIDKSGKYVWEMLMPSDKAK